MSTDPVPIRRLRPKLGEFVTQVSSTGTRLTFTSDGHPGGALVSTRDVLRAGLALSGSWPVEEARRQLARVRQLAEDQGPQAIVTSRSADVAVLVSAEHARVLEEGHPVLEADELRFDGEQLTDQDGRPIPVGTYAYAGGVLRVDPPPAVDDGPHASEEEDTVAD